MLTNNLQGQLGFVFKTVHFHTHLIDTRVSSFSSSDKKDAVLVTIADVNLLGVDGLAVLCPADCRLGFAL